MRHWERLPLLLLLLLALRPAATAAATNTTALAANATAACSARATSAWQARCPARTAANHALLPLSDASDVDLALDDSDVAETYRAARLTALRLSAAAGNAAMAGMRKKSASWYEASLRHLVTYFCVQVAEPAELERCVAPSSPDAARDADRQCVALAGPDSCRSKGLCERASNCKWDDAVAGAASRRELFTAADVAAATKWVERGYPSSLAPFVAPGIVFAVLTALSCVLFVVLRCVFNRCGGRNPREKGYTRCDIVVPSAVFLACTLAVFICSVVTVAQNSNISDGVNGVLQSLNTTLANIEIFATNLQTPLAAAEARVAAASAAVGAQVRGLEWIAADGRTLAQMLEDFGATYAAQGPFPAKACNASSAACVACPDAVCGAPLRAFTASAGGLAAQATGLMVATVQGLQLTFVNQSGELLAGIRAAHREISGVEAMTTRSKALVAVVQSTFDDYSFSRGALVFAVFFFGLVASLLGAFAIFKGVCTKQSPWVHLLHMSWTLGTLVCILGFVLAASLLAVGAVWFDSCSYLNLLQADVAPYVPREVATIVNACFKDSSILEPLGLEAPLGFACAIDDAHTSLRATDLAALKTLTTAYGATVADFGLRDFGFSSTLSRDLLAALNAAAAAAGVGATRGFTQETVVTPWSAYSDAASAYGCGAKNLSADAAPLCFMEGKCGSAAAASASARDKCSAAFASAYNYALSFAKVSAMLDEMREDLLGDTGKGFSPGWSYPVSVAEFADAYFARLAAVRASTLEPLLQSSGDVGKVLETVDTLRCSQSCGWLNISFNAVHNALCNDMLGTTLAISLCVFFLVLFLIPMVVAAVTLQKRLRGVKKGTYEQLERRLQDLEAKTKEETRAKERAASGASAKKIDLSKFKKNLDSA
ncbi:hypothetical protein PybrP1_005812 [[Pythium] brassicae (nom. inval.)]|nr:hypothetical protein PybrP1_005812 [[Pythium] brassicae (nom. inval.)]